jgi:signal transduction histidine kinase
MACSGCISSGEELTPRTLAQARQCTQRLVDDAVTYISSDGTAVFSDFREEGSVWYDGDSYVFVWRTDGIRVVYPPDTTGEGMDMSMLEDAHGTPIGQLFIDVAVTEPNEGWVSYYWPKPNGTTPELKQTYIKKASYEGVDYLVGAGFYVGDYEDSGDAGPCAQ